MFSVAGQSSRILMEFRIPGEIGIPSSSSSGYHPSRASAFSKPTLLPSSSLLSPRGGGAVGGVGGTRNGNIHGHTPSPPPPPPPSTTTLESAPQVVDHPPQSLGKNVDQSSLSSSPPSAAGGGASANSKAKTSIATDATAADVSTKYKECLRNHAAAMGGHVTDGCGEFMPGGEPNTPEALKCAACGCHRSFHRREHEGSGGKPYYHGAAHLPLLLPPPPSQAHPHHQKQFQFGGFLSSPSTAVPGPPGFVQFGGNNPSGSGGTTTESSSEERLINTGTPMPATTRRKRFRTKFTAEQKERMLAFAERVGWRFQRQDDAMVEQFCVEIGVRRQVLKVWMHNNKHTVTRLKQQQQQPHPPSPPPPPPRQEQLVVQQRREQQ